MAASPLPSPETAAVLAGLLIAFLAGATAPTYYAAERLRGFGRAFASRLPYKPPPGMEAEEAMIEATDDDVQPEHAGGSGGKP